MKVLIVLQINILASTLLLIRAQGEDEYGSSDGMAGSESDAAYTEPDSPMYHNSGNADTLNTLPQFDEAFASTANDVSMTASPNTDMMSSPTTSSPPLPSAEYTYAMDLPGEITAPGMNELGYAINPDMFENTAGNNEVAPTPLVSFGGLGVDDSFDSGGVSINGFDGFHADSDDDGASSPGLGGHSDDGTSSPGLGVYNDDGASSPALGGYGDDGTFPPALGDYGDDENYSGDNDGHMMARKGEDMYRTDDGSLADEFFGMDSGHTSSDDKDDENDIDDSSDENGTVMKKAEEHKFLPISGWLKSRDMSSEKDESTEYNENQGLVGNKELDLKSKEDSSEKSISVEKAEAEEDNVFEDKESKTSEMDELWEKDNLKSNIKFYKTHTWNGGILQNEVDSSEDSEEGGEIDDKKVVPLTPQNTSPAESTSSESAEDKSEEKKPKTGRKDWYRTDYDDDFWDGEDGVYDWMDDYFLADADSKEKSSSNESEDEGKDGENSSEYFTPPYRHNLDRIRKYFEHLRNRNRKRSNQIFWHRFLRQRGGNSKVIQMDLNNNQTGNGIQQGRGDTNIVPPNDFGQQKIIEFNPNPVDNLPPRGMNLNPPVSKIIVNDTNDTGKPPPIENGRQPPATELYLPPLKEIPQHPWDWVITTDPTAPPGDLVTGFYDMPPEYLTTPPMISSPPTVHFFSTPKPVSTIRRTTWSDVVLNERTSKPVCQKRIDIVAVVDGKSNSSDFQLMKKSLTKLIHSLAISENKVRFGVILNSNDVTARLPLIGAKAKLLYGVRELTRPRDGRRVDKGLSVMRGMFAIRGRYWAPNIGLVILNDKSKFPALTRKQATEAKRDNINMIAVGVGKKFNQDELSSIADGPDDVITVGDYKGLKDKIEVLIRKVCALAEKHRKNDGGGNDGSNDKGRVDQHVPLVPTSSRRRRQKVPGAWKGKGPCDGCKMLNGAGFNSHPTDCNKFIQCYFGEHNSIRAVYKDCPWGMFWNQTVLTCQDTIDANCPNDPCVFARGKIHQYRSKESCRSYWQCNSHSHLKCCPKGERYVEGSGCVIDTQGTCREECPPRDIEPVVREPVGVVGCDKKPIENDSKHYNQMIPGHGYIKMPCAPGTAFNLPDCGCSVINVYQTPSKVSGCQPELRLEFNDGVRDTSGKWTWVNNQGVDIHGGQAHFNGKSRLLIPRFTSAEFGSTLIIRLRYMETGSFKGKSAIQALVNNGDCGDEGSIQIYTTNNDVGFVVKTNEENGFKGMEITKGNGWKEVEFAVMDGHLEGRVNEISYSKPAKGVIERRNCALQIGYGFGYHNFVGRMDKVEIFKCKPEKKFFRS